MRSHERVRAEISGRRASRVVLLVLVVVVLVVPRLATRTRSRRAVVVSLATRTRAAELLLA